MNKLNSSPPPLIKDLSKCYKSTFSLTFAIEILGIEVWTDFSEGWLETGQPVQGIRLQYQLYPGQNFEIDVVIWPQVAKIWAGSQSCWVRTWQLLERRWLTFSIRHALPVRVDGLQTFVATVTPTVGLGSLGPNAKNERSSEVLIPGLKFGQRRYFAPVLETEVSLKTFVRELIWGAVVEYIPSSYLDGSFDIPQLVTDVRHQDKCLDLIKCNTLNRKSSIKIESLVSEPTDVKSKTKKDAKLDKDKEKVMKQAVDDKYKAKYEITLSGDFILAEETKKKSKSKEVKEKLSRSATKLISSKPLIFSVNLHLTNKYGCQIVLIEKEQMVS